MSCSGECCTVVPIWRECDPGGWRRVENRKVQKKQRLLAISRLALTDLRDCAWALHLKRPPHRPERINIQQKQSWIGDSSVNHFQIGCINSMSGPPHSQP